MSSPDPVASLLEMVQQWAQRNLPAPASGHVGPECQWCPLCQLASALRGENPELTEGLADSVAALVAAGRALLEAAGGASARAADRPRPSPRPKPTRVQPIDLDTE